MHVSLLRQYQAIRGYYVVSLEDIRQKLEIRAPMTGYERLFTVRHPIREHSKKSLTNRKSGVHGIVGLVINVSVKYDKNDNEMAFVGFGDGFGNSVDVVVFASMWEPFAGVIKVGRILKMEIEITATGALLTGDGVIEDFGNCF
jgi:DNA polymerase III alpha subunit